MSIREEFERAFESELGLEFDAKYSVGRPSTIALWAAKWMAERCAELSRNYQPHGEWSTSNGVKIESFPATRGHGIASDIDKLAQELSR